MSLWLLIALKILMAASIGVVMYGAGSLIAEIRLPKRRKKYVGRHRLPSGYRAGQ